MQGFTRLRVAAKDASRAPWPVRGGMDEWPRKTLGAIRPRHLFDNFPQLLRIS